MARQRDGDAEELISALVTAGWLDKGAKGLRVHDWIDHCPEYIRKRLIRRQQGQPLASNGDPLPPLDDADDDRQPMDDNGSYTQPNPTQPNQTKHNPTQPNLEGASASGRRRRTVAFTPPSVEEVEGYCVERKNGINAQDFVDYYTRSGWKLANGQKMVDWQAAVRTWEARRKQTPASRPEGGPRRFLKADP